MPPNRIRGAISASHGQALQTAQQIMDTVRSAYHQQPGAMLIADATLNPLELVMVDGQSGRYYRIPVTSNDDGTFNFAAPIRVTGPTSPNAYPQPPATVNPGQPGGTSSPRAPSLAAASRGLAVATGNAWRRPLPAVPSRLSGPPIGRPGPGGPRHFAH